MIIDSLAWRALEAHAEELAGVHLRSLFETDRQRHARFSLEAEGLLLDYSKQLLDDEVSRRLLALGEEAELAGWIGRLFAGEPVNSTEGRPALHMALRNRSERPYLVGGRDVMSDVRAELARLEALVEGVHEGRITGATGRAFTDVVNIGIGGSDLGAVMAVEALRNYRSGGLRSHFVSNIDGVQIDDALAVSDPETTLFIVCSKSFTTVETLTNARIARRWLVEYLSEHAVRDHFVAVSVNARAMDEFGIDGSRRFAIWDWVGGRYSLWSAIGLVIALSIGVGSFRELLAGGYAMDEHFRTAPLARNLPVLLGLIGIWNASFLRLDAHAVLPYDQRLHRFPAFLQQLEMESNGKRVTRDGRPVVYATCPVVWGEPGSNAQHSFYQLLHQGTGRISTDFLAPVNGSSRYEAQQQLALANCLAQSEALALGQTAAELAEQGVEDRLVPHMVHPGNRPSSTLLFRRLDPATLGKLVALYEHKVFVQGVIWDINAFDQWGVELGKRLARELEAAVADPARTNVRNASTRGLLDRIARWRD